MLSLRVPCRWRPISPRMTRRWSSTKTSDPLRILFCGSDEFSIASLQALHRERQAQPDWIKSINVVCRPPKRVGRGRKELREVPIAHVARTLQLNLHHIDTFTGWQPPGPDDQPINLIVAVSFGLFVPPRILRGARYGGLNVHPSMLPEFRGPSPLHHTLLHGLSRTGISVQTLDAKKFDHGVILAQTPKPGLKIPNPDTITVDELTSFLAPKGAEMLLHVLRDRSYVPPLKGIEHIEVDQERTPTRLAPKPTTEDRRIDWEIWTADQILRRQRVIGPLWNNLSTESRPETRRVIWSGGFVELEPVRETRENEAGRKAAIENSSRVLLRTCDDRYLVVAQMQLDGEQPGPARKTFERIKMMPIEHDQPSVFPARRWHKPW